MITPDFCGIIRRAARRAVKKYELVYRQPAFGAYLRTGSGIRHGSGLFVLTLSGNRICAFTRFDSGVLPWFGLPQSLPPR